MTEAQMNTIVPTINGPYEVHGELEIVAADGRLLARKTEAWLCRCGQSASKPYCDGSHERVGFRDDGQPQTVSIVPAAAGGVLRIGLRVNGPLRIEGRCEVHHPAAGLLFAGEQTALCRCGQSAKKPFCDGTHRQTGFVA
jgi:CDGSH-type Zn-finger protein